MEFAYNNGQPTALAAFEATGRAYLAFARKYPGHYMAMFESGLKFSSYPQLVAASEAAFAILRNACEAVIARLPAAKRPPALMMALHVWSLSHGIASLYGRGDEARRAIPLRPEELLEAAVLIYVDGLGAR